MLVTGISDGCCGFDTDDITLFLTLLPTPCSVPPEGIRSSGERQLARIRILYLVYAQAVKDSQLRIGYQCRRTSGIRWNIITTSYGSVKFDSERRAALFR